MATKMESVAPGEIPDKPEEIPIPEKIPEITPTIIPDRPALPSVNPGWVPDEEPFQSAIPTEIPPSGQ